MLCPCFKYESSLKKTNMLVGRQTTFCCCTCKNHAKLWLMTQKYSKENQKQTVNILQQFYVKDMILFASTIFKNLFCFVLIRNFNHFVLLFITVTGLKISTTMLIPGTTLFKSGSSFPPPQLFRAPRELKMAHLSHHHV